MRNPVTLNPVSPECRSRCIDKLLEKRAAIEAEIEEVAVKKVSIVGQKESFGKEDKQFDQEMAKVIALGNNMFAALKKVNFRIEDFKKGAVSGICPKCDKNFEKELEENPLRELCIACQLIENNSVKK